MCVIVHQPARKYLDKQRAQRLWGINSDGGGFAYIKDGEIFTFKTMEFNKWWSAFETQRSSHRDADFLIHMRIATHGTVDIDNVHPFPVDQYTVMAHNGIIKGVNLGKEDPRSDTKAFVEDLLPKLPEDWLDNDFLFEMVEGWIGWSKLMFLTINPKLKKNVYILNKDASETVEKDGMWFSNSRGVNITSYIYNGTWGEPKNLQPVDPKPLGVRVLTNGVYHETMDDWDSWDQEHIRLEDWGPTKERPREVYKGYAHVLTGPVERRLGLVEARADEGILPPFTYDYGRKEFQCYGCSEVVDEPSGDCACWETLCRGCDNYAARCKCGDYHVPTDPVHWTDMKEAELDEFLDRLDIDADSLISGNDEDDEEVVVGEVMTDIMDVLRHYDKSS